MSLNQEACLPVRIAMDSLAYVLAMTYNYYCTGP